MCVRKMCFVKPKESVYSQELHTDAHLGSIIWLQSFDSIKVCVLYLSSFCARTVHTLRTHRLLLVVQLRNLLKPEVRDAGELRVWCHGGAVVWVGVGVFQLLGKTSIQLCSVGIVCAAVYLYVQYICMRAGKCMRACVCVSQISLCVCVCVCVCVGVVFVSV